MVNEHKAQTIASIGSVIEITTQVLQILNGRGISLVDSSDNALSSDEIHTVAKNAVMKQVENNTQIQGVSNA